MAERDDEELQRNERDDEEARKERARATRPALTLDQEVARRWDPARLGKLVVKGAGRGEKLDLATQSEMARSLPGQDFSNVRVFRGAFADEVLARHKADAVTIANTGMILMRDGARSAPQTRSGQALLAHELTHVAQARRGMHFALAHEHGQGEHEHEAEHVEAEAGGDGHAHHDSAESALQHDAGMRKQIMQRALELMEEQARLQTDRRGGGWEG
jgi:hypothetical protein